MKISNIKKSYENFSLNINSLDISEKKIYGIIGPNGCGKTTAMKLMAGIEKPDSGHIEYGELAPRDMTMLLRKPYLLSDTVINNLVYPLKLRKIKPDIDIVNHYLDITGLTKLRNELALRLSGGEQQKLALARALIFSPKVIFIDEGFSHMDIESVAFFENYILEMQRKKPMTWVIISHQLSNIRRLCEHVFFMHNGEVRVSDSTESLLSDPSDEKLKRYLQYM